MKRVLLTLAALAALGLVGAVAVVWLGLYNVSARVGHLPGVSWVLHTTFQNSARLRAPPQEEVPPLDDPALIALGEMHYATACTPCHAAPGETASATMRAMLPQPPQIEEAVQSWRATELHWIVENGIKMSGMPAWPSAGRDDEVWSIVAYLHAVKRGAITAPPPRVQPIEAPQAYCESCHGRIEAHVPRLDIQDEAYLADALRDYLDGTRPSGIMAQAASAVPPDALPVLARHFAGPARGDTSPLPDQTDHPGAALALRGTDQVPACIACHGPGRERDRARMPRLAGQDEAFLAAQLRLWRDGVRTGSPLMEAAARRLEGDQIEALAAWYASLEP